MNFFNKIKSFKKTTITVQGIIFENSFEHSNFFLVNDKRIFFLHFLNEQTQNMFILGNYLFVEVLGIIKNKNFLVVKELKILDLPKENFFDFYLSSKYSFAQSLIDIEAFIKNYYLKNNNNKFISLVDVHTFQFIPKILKWLKNTNLKLLPGIEMNMIDDSEIYQQHTLISIKKTRLVFIDLETTGINPHNDSIIEVACVELNFQTGSLITLFNTLIFYDGEFSKYLMELTGITKEKLKFKEKEETVIKKLFKLLQQGNIVLLSHSNFDFGFLRMKFKKYGCTESLNFNYLDTLDFFRIFLKNKIKKFTLEKIINFFNLEKTNRHRAYQDAKNTALAFYRVVQLYNLNLEEIFRATRDLFLTKAYRIILFPKKKIDLKVLFYLISLSYSNFFYKTPRLPKSILKKYKKNFIFISAFENGEITQRYFRGLSILKELVFYDYYQIFPLDTSLRILNLAFSRNRFINSFTLKNLQIYLQFLFKERSNSILFSKNIKFFFSLEALSLEVLKTYKQSSIDQDFMKSNFSLFKFRSLLTIKKQFLFLKLEEQKKLFSLNIERFLFSVCKIKNLNLGIKKVKKSNNFNFLLKKHLVKKLTKIYGLKNNFINKRLDYELSLIFKYNFSNYYLLALDVVQFVLKEGYFFSSRGSVGSSLVAFLLGISEVNPLLPHYYCAGCFFFQIIEQEECGLDLPNKICSSCNILLKKDGNSIKFEIFSGLDGTKKPDIDLNFSSYHLNLIHNYLFEKYNKQLIQKENFKLELDFKSIKVIKSGTILTIQKRNAFFYFSKFIEKIKPENTSFNFLNREIYREFVLSRLIGCKIADGQHPGGLFILRENEENFLLYTPLKLIIDKKSKKNFFLSHFSYQELDSSLFKLDILGHDIPLFFFNIVKYSVPSPNDIDISDRKLLKLFTGLSVLNFKKNNYEKFFYNGTAGLPEFGTSFVRRILKKLRPKSIRELVKISGLTHGIHLWRFNIAELIKKGFLTLKEAYTSRDDIWDFLMKYNISKEKSYKITEFIRKGKTKKKSFLLEKKEIIKFLLLKKIPRYFIDSLLEISYIFPKAHAIAYVIASLKMAFYKIYYSKEFYTAFLNTKIKFVDYQYFIMENFQLFSKLLSDKKKFLDQKTRNENYVIEIIIEARLRSIYFLPIDLYRSTSHFFVFEKDGIRPPLIILKGLGEKVVETIIIEAQKKKFTSEVDFKKRTKASVKIVEILEKNHIIKFKKFKQGVFF